MRRNVITCMLLVTMLSISACGNSTTPSASAENTELFRIGRNEEERTLIR